MPFWNYYGAPMKIRILGIVELPQCVRFSGFFALFMVALALGGLYLDWSLKDDFYWFQRSGALLVLAGVELQYAKLKSMWKEGLEEALAIPSVAQRIASGQGVSLRQEAETADATRRLLVRLHMLVTEKSLKDVLAVVFLIVGTVVWGFGDLPFRI
jgi:hypothetical protein